MNSSNSRSTTSQRPKWDKSIKPIINKKKALPKINIKEKPPKTLNVYKTAKAVNRRVSLESNDDSKSRASTSKIDTS